MRRGKPITPRRRRPPLWARRGVILAATALPAGAARDRYREEFIADLHALPRSRQAAYTVSVLANAWALRGAVTGDPGMAKEATMKTRKPLTCRLNMRHLWRLGYTEDGGRFRQCERCGKFDPGSQYPGEGTAYPV